MKGSEAMYATMVRRRVRGVFDAINQGDYPAMIDSLAPRFRYTFHGEHALSGTRTTRAAMKQWWERLLRLLPDAHFEVQDVVVNGTPWNTRAATRLRVTGTQLDGESYENIALQFLTLRWGAVTSVETLEDLHVLDRALQAARRAGHSEAMAPPITDEPRAAAEQAPD